MILKIILSILITQPASSKVSDDFISRIDHRADSIVVNLNSIPMGFEEVRAYDKSLQLNSFDSKFSGWEIHGSRESITLDHFGAKKFQHFYFENRSGKFHLVAVSVSKARKYYIGSLNSTETPNSQDKCPLIRIENPIISLAQTKCPVNSNLFKQATELLTDDKYKPEPRDECLRKYSDLMDNSFRLDSTTITCDTSKSESNVDFSQPNQPITLGNDFLNNKCDVGPKGAEFILLHELMHKYSPKFHKTHYCGEQFLGETPKLVETELNDTVEHCLYHNQDEKFDRKVPPPETLLLKIDNPKYELYTMPSNAWSEGSRNSATIFEENYINDKIGKNPDKFSAIIRSDGTIDTEKCIAALEEVLKPDGCDFKKACPIGIRPTPGAMHPNNVSLFANNFKNDFKPSEQTAPPQSPSSPDPAAAEPARDPASATPPQPMKSTSVPNTPTPTAPPDTKITATATSSPPIFTKPLSGNLSNPQNVQAQLDTFVPLPGSAERLGDDVVQAVKGLVPGFNSEREGNYPVPANVSERITLVTGGQKVNVNGTTSVISSPWNMAVATTALTGASTRAMAAVPSTPAASKQSSAKAVGAGGTTADSNPTSGSTTAAPTAGARSPASVATNFSAAISRDPVGTLNQMVAQAKTPAAAYSILKAQESALTGASVRVSVDGKSVGSLKALHHLVWSNGQLLEQ